MSIGTGIFLSSLLFSIVILFAVTKDRWNWTRIFKWGLLLSVSSAILLGASLYFYLEVENHPNPQMSFNNIPITASPADVKFLKGNPASVDGPNRWTYNAGTTSKGSESERYLIQFKDNQLHFIMYHADDSVIYTPHLLGLNSFSTYEQVQEKLGPPSHTSESKDELSRIISYDKLNVFFMFEQGHVSAYGIYQPKIGPVRFANNKTE